MEIIVLYSVFDLAELNTLARQITDKVKKAYGVRPLLQPLLAEMERVLDLADSSLASSTRDDLTALVALTDSQRDECYVALRGLIGACLRRIAKPEVQEAAQRLYRTLERHGLMLYKEAFARQTALLNSLFKDLAQPQAVADLAALGATEWLEDLKAYQAKFEEAFDQRNSSLLASESRLKDDEAKRQLKVALDNLLALLRGMHIAQALPDSEQVLKEINKTVEMATKAARDRSGAGGAGSEVPPEGEFPDDPTGEGPDNPGTGEQ